MILARAKEVPCLVLTCFSAVAKNVPLHPLLPPQPLLYLHPKPKTFHPSHPPKLSQVKEKNKIHNLVHRFYDLAQKLKLSNLPCVSIVHLPHKCHFWWSCLWWCYSLQKMEKLRLSKLAQASRPLTDWAKRGGGRRWGLRASPADAHQRETPPLLLLLPAFSLHFAHKHQMKINLTQEQ